MFAEETTPNTPELLTVVVSVYNEKEVLPLFWTELHAVLCSLPVHWEVIFVNDGSCDGSAEWLDSLVERTDRVKVLHLSRNFGHEAAMIAGIDHGQGHALVCMDADLQHPPAALAQLLASYQRGHEVILMVRNQNAGASLAGACASSLFYRLINLLSPGYLFPNASDFFLISRRVAEILRKDYRERSRFIRGVIQSVGFRREQIGYDAPKRAGGESKYSLLKLTTLSLAALTGFSRLPLRLGLLVGCMTGVASIMVGIYSIIMKFLGYVIPGYTTIVVLASFMFSLQFLILGLIGEYVGFIFDEIKARPIYLIDRCAPDHKGKRHEPAA